MHPYRFPAPLTCRICSAADAVACQNCRAVHCRAHLLDGSCAGCRAALFGLERRRTRRLLWAYGALALPAAAVALAFSFSGETAALVMPALFLLLLGFVATRAALAPLVSRSLRKVTLPVTSRPLALVPPPEPAPSAPRASARPRRWRLPLPIRGGKFEALGRTIDLG
jgi:hypothetical protein